MKKLLKPLFKKMQEQLIVDIYVFPFGKRGKEVYEYLKKEDVNVRAVDNILCAENSGIISLKDLSKIISDSTESIVLIALDNPALYEDLRIEVKRLISEEKIIDLYPWNPLTRHYDDRVASLALAAKQIYLNNCEGAVAEAGVYQGDFAKYINILFPQKRLYLFDTYEGFNPDWVAEEDNKTQTDKWVYDWGKDTNVELVLSKMKFKDRVVIKKGVFPDTTVGIDERFAFVNLDMDLYLPIYQGLVYFYERLNPGGFIFVHDINNYDGVRTAIEQFCEEKKIGYFCASDRITAIIRKDIKAER